jgi:hypothetical protein
VEVEGCIKFGKFRTRHDALRPRAKYVHSMPGSEECLGSGIFDDYSSRSADKAGQHKLPGTLYFAVGAPDALAGVDFIKKAERTRSRERRLRQQREHAATEKVGESLLSRP